MYCMYLVVGWINNFYFFKSYLDGGKEASTYICTYIVHSYIIISLLTKPAQPNPTQPQKIFLVYILAFIIQNPQAGLLLDIAGSISALGDCRRLNRTLHT